MIVCMVPHHRALAAIRLAICSSTPSPPFSSCPPRAASPGGDDLDDEACIRRGGGVRPIGVRPGPRGTLRQRALCRRAPTGLPRARPGRSLKQRERNRPGPGQAVARARATRIAARRRFESDSEWPRQPARRASRVRLKRVCVAITLLGPHPGPRVTGGPRDPGTCAAGRGGFWAAESGFGSRAGCDSDLVTWSS
jgi:hypothetical protein